MGFIHIDAVGVTDNPIFSQLAAIIAFDQAGAVRSIDSRKARDSIPAGDVPGIL